LVFYSSESNVPLGWRSKSVRHPLENSRAGIIRQGNKWRHCTSSGQKTKTKILKVESRNYAPRIAPANRWKFFFNLPETAFPFVPAGWSAFRGAESAHEKDDKAYQQNQAKPAAADDGTTKVKPAAAEQKQKNNYEE
jgi:hypothetical protein